MAAINRLSLLVVIAYMTLIGLINTVSANGGRKTVVVHHGESIQAAINSAHNGDRIFVEAGTYPEQLTISKDGIALVGDGAILVPPPNAVTNTCSGLAGNMFPDYKIPTQAGICVTGTDVKLADFASEHRKFISVGKRVKDVSITGFTVQGFSGLNIAIVGAADTCVFGNTLTDGAMYGALTVGSKNSNIEFNTVTSSPPTPTKTFLNFIGICMDDVSSVTVAHNDISTYNIGLCVETNGANIFGNHVKNCCIGAYVDPAINGAKLIHNTFKDTNPACQNSATSGSFLIAGIYIAGAVNTEVRGNLVTGITTNGHPELGGVGVGVEDDFPLPYGTADVGSGNVVEHNVIKNNDLDVGVGATGKGNVVKDNICKSSLPAGLCK